MADNNNARDQPPDLASVLRTLAALAPKNNAVPPTQTSSYGTPLPQPSTLANLSIDPRRVPQRSTVSLRPPRGYRDVSPPSTDQTSILEWPKGLRYVNQTASQSPYFEPAIRKMIAEQEKHERMWWQSRLALSEKYGNPEPKQIPDEMRKELELYDRKVHAASQELVNSMTAELRRLGVPFFGVRPELVKPSMVRGEITTSPEPFSQAPKDSVVGITEADLLKLQRKMIQYLEDMYKG